MSELFDKIESLEKANIELQRQINCLARFIDVDLVLELELEKKKKVKRK